jgi:antitoxin ParD1/3/4
MAKLAIPGGRAVRWAAMSARTTLNVSLTPDLGEFVTAKVASGRYRSASEVVREGLRLLEEQDRLREAALAEVRRKIEAGLASLDRGKGLSGDEVFGALEARLASRRTAARG